MKRAEMMVKRISGIWRPLSLKYPTNRAIIIIVASVFLLVTLLKLVVGESFIDSIIWAFSAAAALFFAWAIARELDPDSNASAFIAATLMLVALFFANLPVLLTLFWFLLISRILNSVTGVAPKILDLAGVITLAVLLSWQELWVYGLITVLALYLNSWMDGEKKKGIILAVIVLPLMVLSAFLGSSFFITAEISVCAIVTTTIFTLFFIPIICTTTRIKSLTDITGEPVKVTRLRVVRVVMVITGILVAIMQGNTGFYNLLPLWAAIGGIIIWGFYKFIECYRKNEY